MMRRSMLAARRKRPAATCLPRSTRRWTSGNLQRHWWVAAEPWTTGEKRVSSSSPIRRSSLPWLSLDAPVRRGLAPCSVCVRLLCTSRQSSKDGEKKAQGEPIKKPSSPKEDEEGPRSSARETWWTVPNIITMTRIACSPVLSWLILEGRYKEAVIGVVIAGGTDLLDGYIARSYNQQSILGGFLDPLADKVLVAALSLPLAYLGHIPVPLLVVMFGRDALLVGGSLILRYKQRPPGAAFFDTTSSATFEIKPNTLSKVNTGLQFLVLAFALSRATYGVPGPELFQPFCWLVGSTTVISGLMYLGGDGTAKLGKTVLKMPALTKEQGSKAEKNYVHDKQRK